MGSTSGQEVVKGLGTVGGWASKFAAGFATILGIACIVAGIVLFGQHTPSNLTSSVWGTPSTGRVPPCSQDSNWSCSFTLEFQINDVEYMKPFHVKGENFGGKDRVKVYYDPNDVTQVSVVKERTPLIPYNVFGWLLLGFGILVILMGWAYYFFVKSSSTFAAASGAAVLLQPLL